MLAQIDNPPSLVSRAVFLPLASGLVIVPLGAAPANVILDTLKTLPVKPRLGDQFGGYPPFTRVGLPNGRAVVRRT
jgi:hypothetical protein